MRRSRYRQDLRIGNLRRRMNGSKSETVTVCPLRVRESPRQSKHIAFENMDATATEPTEAADALPPRSTQRLWAFSAVLECSYVHVCSLIGRRSSSPGNELAIL